MKKQRAAAEDDGFTMVTDPTTGGQKGRKADRQDLIDPFALEQLGLVCGFGARKYSDDNWRRGYNWSLSYGALRRHLNAWQNGEDLDPESGLPHLAHCMWHCMVLLWYGKTGAGTDDRPCNELWKETPDEG